MLARVWITHTLLVGMGKGTATLENNLALSEKLSDQLPYNTTSILLDIIPEKWKIMFTQTSVFDAYSSFIHNNSVLEIAKISLNRWMINKVQYIHTMEYCPGIRRKEFLMHAPTWITLQRIRLSEKTPIPKGYILCESIYITFLKWQNKRMENRLVVVRN